MKSNPDIYQAMVLGKTEDKLNFKLADIDMKTTEKTCLKKKHCLNRESQRKGFEVHLQR